MPTVTEPLFLGARRRQALDLAGRLPLPSRTDEHWRRTSLEGLDAAAYKPGPAKVRLEGNVPEGVIFTDILTAAAEKPELVQQYLGTLVDMSRDQLTALQ
ncbi:MAG TPA: hypothetical protein VD902_15205, partial [Symbiobacteriaceae bacterium]|nr:hypothetical protein [Symbiobacteriaceae bacterium]